MGSLYQGSQNDTVLDAELRAKNYAEQAQKAYETFASEYQEYYAKIGLIYQGVDEARAEIKQFNLRVQAATAAIANDVQRAEQSATNAGTHESNANTYASNARDWSEHPHGTEVTPGHYSALHWSVESSSNAQSAAQSKLAVDQAKTEVEADKTKVQSLASQVATDKQAVDADAQTVLADKNIVLAAKTDVLNAVSTTFADGGVWTPNAQKEYPDKPNPAHSTIWFIILPKGQTYTFTTGDLKNDDHNVVEHGSRLYYDAVTDRFWGGGDGNLEISEIVLPSGSKRGNSVSIGLADIASNLRNWQASSDTDSQSITQYATSKAVYDAYQYAESAANTAGQKADLNGSTTEQFEVPTTPATDNSSASKKYVDDGRHPNENLLINGDFTVAQTGFGGNMTSGEIYVVDDCQVVNGGTFSQVHLAQGAGHPNPLTKYLDFQIGTTGSAYGTELYRTIESVPINDSPVTLSFWGWNYSDDSQPKDVEFRVYVLKISDKSIVWGGTPNTITLNHLDSDYWAGGDKRYTSTIVVPDIPELQTKNVHDEYYCRVDLRFPDNSKIQIGGQKLERGDKATDFVPDLPQVNLAKCQRLYVDNDVSEFLLQPSTNSNSRRGNLKFPVTMRKVPSVNVKQQSGTTVTADVVYKDGARLLCDTTDTTTWVFTDGYVANARY
ncbi:tail fiber protein [Vibrio mediterranei]|uniref:tail fiber protein n=1 Tax=Vibrio mediterranei TaxID=689 RepID=UPI00183CE186|nr:tail fiber protein [Vibrio mediterranei]NUW71418.1 tail fiber protein [Vibrio mediterranei]